MCIIQNYDLLPKEDEENTYSCKSLEVSVCPDCDSVLIYRDKRKRIMRCYNSEVWHVIIRRMKCPKCNCLHNEIPDCIVPYKQFAAEIIERKIDGNISGEDEILLEDQPCDKTVTRWYRWLKNITPELFEIIIKLLKNIIESHLASINKENLLLSIRQFGAGWISFISIALTKMKPLNSPLNISLSSPK